MLITLKAILKKILLRDYKYKSSSFKGSLEKLGSSYGGWIIPVGLINKDSICYLAGAGEDITFDVELASRFLCNVFIFDPTPRAKEHFEKVKEGAFTGTPVAINNNPSTVYKLNIQSINHLNFEQTGIWKQTDTLKFYAPKDETHVSHSISNLQQTNKYFEAHVERLSSIMKRNNHTFLDILKLDIEGAEFDVIDSIIEDSVIIKILCIEFHKNDKKDLIQSAISKLEGCGFIAIAREELDFTFINQALIADYQK